MTVLTVTTTTFIFYSIYTTLTLSVYSHVLGYFWLSRLKPKIPKKHKKQISNFKKPLVFSTPERCVVLHFTVLQQKC